MLMWEEKVMMPPIKTWHINIREVYVPILLAYSIMNIHSDSVCNQLCGGTGNLLQLCFVADIWHELSIRDKAINDCMLLRGVKYYCCCQSNIVCKSQVVNRYFRSTFTQFFLSFIVSWILLPLLQVWNTKYYEKCEGWNILTLTLLRGWWGRCEKTISGRRKGREGGEKMRAQRPRRGSNPVPAAC